VVLDVTLLATQYTNNFDIQTTYKPVVYRIKLKIEFIILNELLLILKGGNARTALCTVADLASSAIFKNSRKSLDEQVTIVRIKVAMDNNMNGITCSSHPQLR
jgi:hypothetical protein